eukprot:gene10095-2515_t
MQETLTKRKENPMDLIDEPRLDDDEQEAIIEAFEENYRFNSKIFRSALCCLSGVFGLLFLFLGYISDDFAENVSHPQVQFVHFATSLGFFLLCYRILYSKTRVKNEDEAEENEYLDHDQLLEIQSQTAFHFKLFWFISFLSIFEMVLFLPFAKQSFEMRKQIGYFNSRLILFPSLLPIFHILVWISFRVLSSMKKDINDLYSKRYHFKTL